jgi:NADPH:quinone reductase-like Zn-dependent oxidoreductase
MQAAFYAKQGSAREVLQVGEHPTPEPGPGEVRVHLKTSGVNPSDWKSRSGRTAPMLAPLIIPHSDGAGDTLIGGNSCQGLGDAGTQKTLNEAALEDQKCDHQRP